MYHNETGACAGTIYLSEDVGICKVVVYKENSSMPHFHIINEALDWECCLEMFSHKYFMHSSKQKLINNKQMKIIDEWLRKKIDYQYPIFSSTATNWDLLTIFWEAHGNELSLYPDEFKQPDYTKLKIM